MKLTKKVRNAAATKLTRAIKQAAKEFGGTDGVFTAAGFSNAFTALAKVEGVIDGRLVLHVLAARGDVEVLGDGYYRQKRAIDEFTVCDDIDLLSKYLTWKEFEEARRADLVILRVVGRIEGLDDYYVVKDPTFKPARYTEAGIFKRLRQIATTLRICWIVK